MNEPHPTSGSSAAGGPQAAAKAPRGPETVINPERRAGLVLPAAEPLAATVGNSSVVRKLFPSADDAAVAAFDAPPGVELEHFSIIERIHSGGMGAVFRALDVRLNRVVALKVLPPALSRDSLLVQRFLVEAQAAAQLDHENIARVYYVGEQRGLHFIAFEFVKGVNVRDLIAREGRLGVADTVNYGLQLASALIHTAAQGVVHRDIKPSNVIITPTGRAKLVDLGLARQENRDRPVEPAADLTMAGTTLGTFDYISPEQARDPRVADVRSDIYSLGCTLYHMLAGEPPYPEGTVLQKLLQHQGDEAPDPALKNHAVPASLSAVIRQMMAKDPGRRYQSALELYGDLLLIGEELGMNTLGPEGGAWLTARATPAAFWQRNLAWLAAAAVLLVIVGFLEFGGGAGSPLPPFETLGPTSIAPRYDRPDVVSQNEQGDAGDTSRKTASQRSAESVRPPTAAASGAPPAVPGAISGGAPDVIGNVGISAPYPTELPSFESIAGTYEFDETISEYLQRGLPNEQPPVVEPPPRRGLVVGRGGNGGGAPATNQPLDEPLTSRGGDVSAPRGGATADSDEGVFLLGREGAPDRRFATLEAACAAVKNDGAVIELRFNGSRVETGFRVARRVTIRAGAGCRPTIDLRPLPVVTDSQIRTITVPSGSLDLIGVDLTLTVDESQAVDEWFLFSLERPDSLRLQGATVTLVNTRHAPAAVVELRPSLGGAMPDMPPAGMPLRPPLDIEFDDSFLRGQADVFSLRHTEPTRIRVRQCVLAVQGAFLSARGTTELSHENAQLEVRLEHVTAAAGGGFLQLDSGNLPRKLLPTQVSASDCIFSNVSAAGALVAMSGNSPPQDFRALLFWSGRNNVYDRYATYWSMQSTDGTARADVWDFAAWKSNWTDAFEVNPRRVEGAIWERRQWAGKPLHQLSPDDFALDRQAASNPAVAGATDSTDVGASLSRVAAAFAREGGGAGD
ncbi:MAG: serine/threonine-protein kinase [Planctomycetaceae bacterium]